MLYRWSPQNARLGLRRKSAVGQPSIVAASLDGKLFAQRGVFPVASRTLGHAPPLNLNLLPVANKHTAADEHDDSSG